MKRAIGFVCMLAVAVVCVASVCVWLAPPEAEIVVPPNRFGSSSMSLGRSYTFEEAALEADIVAHVRVGSWLGDDEVEWHMSATYFEAEPVTVYKGELPERFVLRQDGSSDSPYMVYPLFTYGNELFLFMKNVPDESAEDYPENCCWIIGSFSSVCYVEQDGEGVSYAVPHGVNDMPQGESFAVAPYESRAEITASLAANDPEVWSGKSVSTAYPVEELGARVIEICAEK